MTKEQMKVLLTNFGTCRCDKACQVEQYSDESMRDKPGGRYSVCEIEAEKNGLKIPPREEDIDGPCPEVEG